MRLKVMEPILLLGQTRFEGLNIRVRVRGGGQNSQIMAIRQAIAKGVIAYAQKYEDESQKRTLKELLIQYDKSLLVADPRRCEPKKFGGHGARARFQKSYRWAASTTSYYLWEEANARIILPFLGYAASGLSSEKSSLQVILDERLLQTSKIYSLSYIIHSVSCPHSLESCLHFSFRRLVIFSKYFCFF